MIGEILTKFYTILPEPTTTETSSKASIAMTTKIRRMVTRQPNKEVVTKAPSGWSANGITLIIPILATLLFCTILLIIATMLYRYVCILRNPYPECMIQAILFGCL